MKTKSFIALSLGWLAVSAAGCNDTPADSSLKAEGAPAAAFPVAILPLENDASRYYVYVPSQGGETGFNYCLNNTLIECSRGTGARQMAQFNDPANRRFYVFGPTALPEGTKLNFVSVNGTTALKTRSVRLAAGTGATLALESPKERQVFQRTSKDRGKIVVQVKDANVRFVRAKVSGTSRTGNGLVGDGQFKEYEVTSQRASVDAPAGGWFSLDVEMLDAQKRNVGQAQVREVGVGEVFLVAGQSNSTNCGRERQVTNSEYVMSTDGVNWRKGDDPQLGTHDDHQCNENNGYGGSNWPNTGRELTTKLQVPVAFASTGYSGTAIREWLPGAAGPDRDNKGMNLFDYTSRRAQQLTALGGFRAVLWHQGENDAKDDTTKADYQSKLGQVITGIRGKTGVTNPWLIAVASWCAEDAYPADANGKRWGGVSAEVTGAQQEIVSSKQLPELYSGPSTDDLQEQYRGTAQQPKDCHFNGSGLKTVGTRWAEKISAFVEGRATTSSDATAGSGNSGGTNNTNNSPNGEL